MLNEAAFHNSPFGLAWVGEQYHIGKERREGGKKTRKKEGTFLEIHISLSYFA